MKIYQQLLNTYNIKATRLQQTLARLSFARLLAFVLFIFCSYEITQTGSAVFIILTVICFAAFFILLRWYQKLQQKTIYYQALAGFNKNEIEFINTNRSTYATGKEYEDAHHPYSYDLDLFGEGGLFSYLNRCSTSFGRQALANDLLQPETNVITQRQEAIKELAQNISFRQNLYAHGNLHESREKDLRALMAWVHAPGSFIKKSLYYVLMIFPLVTIASLVYYFFTGNEIAFSLFSTLFVVNLFIAFGFARKITSQLSVSTSVTKILRNYKSQLSAIESAEFTSPLLKQYQQQLTNNNIKASQLINRLSALFEYLETLVNLVVSLLLNGLFLFHIHILYLLGNWKKRHAGSVIQWLELIGRFESLSSFANLSYNNPSFCFAETSATPGFEAESLGHVLIREQKRVCNDVSFNQQKFIILTGSNMSGKSTFLRTLGTNLVLARAGSAVCATRFTFYPFDVFVSMRITDSLQDSESFFYAELKRLQSIIQHLQNGNITFVILDEILRGTNSNDKRNGTIGLIKKLAKENTFGIIATHDVIVAELAKEYPSYISNKAFESAIINDELLFDYQLKNGVCTTLSASYLMKKMGVIE